MKDVVEFVGKELGKHGVRMDVGGKMDALVVSGKVNEFMTPQAVYTVFLLHMSRESEMYKRILNGSYVFDMEVEIADRKERYSEERMREWVEEIYGERMQYVYVHTEGCRHFVGIKLGRRAYDAVAGYDGAEDAIPYFLLANGLGMDVRDIRWNEVVFGFADGENERAKYVEILQHVKEIRLPVSIVDDDAMHLDTAATNVHRCYLHCGSHENWPEDQQALECAKTALYCLIYKKSRYRCGVGYDHVLLKYRGSYFRFQIAVKQDRRTGFRVDARIAEIMGEESGVFMKGVVCVKRFLERHGYFPVYFDDRTVELLCLMFGRGVESLGRFFNVFLDFRIDLEGCSLNLETFRVSENRSGQFEAVYKHDMLCVDIPPAKVVARLNALKKKIRMQMPALFDKNLQLQTQSLLQPSFGDYDFVLSARFSRGLVEIRNQAPAQFVLGVPLVEQLLTPALREKGFFFYVPGEAVLMVKAKHGTDPNELFHVLVLKTAFRYCLRNFSQ